EQFCSSDTARDMARRAFERAERLAPCEPVVGLGCTASLATDRPKRGDHRFHVAIHDDCRTVTNSMTLAKGARDRSGEEQVVGGVVLNALAESCGVAERLDMPYAAEEKVQTTETPAAGPFAAFHRGQI